MGGRCDKRCWQDSLVSQLKNLVRRIEQFGNKHYDRPGFDHGLQRPRMDG